MSDNNFDKILDENSTNTVNINDEFIHEKPLITESRFLHKVDEEMQELIDQAVEELRNEGKLEDTKLEKYNFDLDIRDVLLEYDETVKNFQFKNPETGNLITIATAMTYKQKNPSVYMIARVLARKLLSKKIDPKDSGRVNVDKILKTLNTKQNTSQPQALPSASDVSLPSDVSVSTQLPTKKIVGKKLTSINVLDHPITVLQSWPQDLVDTQHVKSGKSKIYGYVKNNATAINTELAKKPDVDSYKLVMNQFNKFNTNLGDILKNPNDPKYASLLMDLVKFMADMGDESAKALFDSESKVDNNNIKNYMLELIKNENLRNELLELINNKFPLKKVLSGQARMKIGGNVVDSNVLGKIFNSANVNAMTQKIDPYKDKNSMPYLAYSFGEKNNTQKIAKIYITDDSSNDGSNFKFDMKLYDAFANNIEKTITDTDNTEKK